PLGRLRDDCAASSGHQAISVDAVFLSGALGALVDNRRPPKEKQEARDISQRLRSAFIVRAAGLVGRNFGYRFRFAALGLWLTNKSGQRTRWVLFRSLLQRHDFLYSRPGGYFTHRSRRSGHDCDRSQLGIWSPGTRNWLFSRSLSGLL